MRWNDWTHRYGYVLAMTGITLCAIKQLQAAEIPPIVGPWGYSANECTNYSNPSTWAADCRILDGGVWAGSGTASDPWRCETPSHPRPWSSEDLIEPLASARAGSPAVLQGWQADGNSVYCTGVFDNGTPTTTLGVESSNFSLLAVSDEPDAWGARRDREIKCPNGTWTLTESCLQFPIADPYRAFEFCPKNGTNPVNAFTGAKIHIETDLRVRGANPLVFTRYYSTRTEWRHSPWEQSGFGQYWRHNYTVSVKHFENDSFEAVTLFRETGNRFYFHSDDTESGRVWRPTDAGIRGELSEIEIDGAEYWNYLSVDGIAERFAKIDGRLHHTVDQEGLVTTFHYNEAGLLREINNGFGKSLVLQYGEQGLARNHITSVALQVNQNLVLDSVIRYEYEQTDPTGYTVMLDKVIYPDQTPTDSLDNPFKDYLYNEADHIYYDEEWKVNVTDGPSNRSANHPSKLTGIVDENGNRFATYKYQRVLFNGGYRFMLPVWGGHGSPDASGSYADAYRIVRYHPDSHRGNGSSHNGFATVIDGLGNSRQFHFTNSAGVLRPTSIVGDQCEVCGSDAQLTSYDANGFVSETTDFAGNKTLYVRNEIGQELCRLEGVSTEDPSKNAPRKTTMTWDSQHRVLLQSTVYAPATDVDLAICDPNNADGWIKRLEVTREYEANSGRIAQLTKRSYSVAGVPDEPPRITTFLYYGDDEQGGLQYQLKQIDGPRTDVIDIQKFRYATDYSEDHSPGDLIEIENSLGHLTKFTKHDAFGRVIESVNPSGVVSVTRYHPRGWITLKETGDQRLIFEYDNVGLIKKTIQSEGDIMEYRYDSAHRLTDIVDSFGNSIHYDLDPVGNRISENIYAAEGNLRRQLQRSINRSNQVEKVISFVDSDERHTRGFVYDENGDLLRLIDPRDPAISADDPLPSEPTIYSSREYDALRRPVVVRDSEGGFTRYEYDVFDNLTRVTEPNDGDTSTPQGLSTFYKYNSFGELKRIDSPDTGITQLSYDEAGNLITRQTAQLRAEGEVINYYYDAVNRLLLADYPGDDLDVSYEYDNNIYQQYGVGKLYKISDASGTTQFSHDRYGNLIEINFLREGLEKSIRYTFNNANQLTSIRTPSGKEIRINFRAPSQGLASTLISGIELHDEFSALTLVDDVQYAPFGPLESWVFHNGIEAHRALDFSYETRRISHGSLINREYIRDAAANVLQISDNITADVETFTYDGLNRLTSMASNDASITYQYDAIGNRREVLSNSLPENYFYSPQTHHLIKTEGISTNEFQFDSDGNMISRNGLRISYGGDSRSKVLLTDQTPTASFKHNALGQRTEKEAAYKTLYYYDWAGRLLEEGDQFGNPSKTYIYLENMPIAMVEEGLNPFEDSDEDGMRNGFEMNYGLNAFDSGDADLDLDGDTYSNLSEHDADTDPTDPYSFPMANTHTVKQIPALGKLAALLAAAAALALILPHLNSALAVISCVLILSWLVAQSATAEVHYVHVDHLGTPIMMTDSHQSITWRARYTPFGMAEVDPASTTELNLRFPGQYFDRESGFHYNYFRDYDPSTGRYLQSDPIGLKGGINTFVYALANPLKYLDRFGLWVMRCARKLGSPDNSPVRPSGNPLRHDYLSVSGNVLSFQAGTGNGWRDMFKSQGWIDTQNEHPTNPKCEMVCDDDEFDQFVFQASAEIGAPTYCIIPGMPGAANCQSWASDVLELATKNYLKNVACPKCFTGSHSEIRRRFGDNFGRAL